MQIDWLTVVAQTVNFLILVWLLKRFLYQPVIDAMDTREARLTARLNVAADRESLAIETTHDYERQLKSLEDDRNDLMAAAEADAEAKRRTLLNEARTEVATQRQHWQTQLVQEQTNFANGLKHEAAAVFERIARRGLADLADVELEEQIVRLFIKRLKSPAGRATSKLAESKGPIEVATSFELTSALHGALTRALQQHFGSNTKLTYKVSPELFCGIELSAPGERLSWTIAEYLDDLENAVRLQLGAERAAN